VNANHFTNILFLPPPDCPRCKRPTVWRRTPTRFRTAGAVNTSGARDLCGPCYVWLRQPENREELEDYPRKYRRSTDVYEDYLILRKRHPDWFKRAIAREMGMSLSTLDRSIVRARHAERGPATDSRKEVAA